ncbi:MAG: hypothetical protein ISS18_13995 [Bacteroidales bacterium]|nr:hypothetical protein [Bacteroidales bacterium]
MKKLNRILIGVVIFAIASTFAKAQNYELAVTNGQKIVVKGLLGKIIIKSHSGTKLLIETKGYKDVPEKAKGLKEIYGGGIDNTGIGLSVKESGKIIMIGGASKRSEDAKYTFFVPDNVSMKIDYSSPFGYDDIEVADFSGELEVEMLNAGINLTDVTGPLTIHTINGDIKAVFHKLNQKSPSSITSINGNVEITVPASTPANLKLGTMNGEIYTDCDIKFENKNKKGDEEMIMIGGHSNTEGKLNGGGVEMTLSSINGSIYLRKK